MTFPGKRVGGPSKKRIASAQMAKLLELKPHLKHYPIEDTCWACDMEDIPVEKAHIMAHAHAGTNEPDNFLLLCSFCHLEQPDAAPEECQWQWLKTRDCWQSRELKRVKLVVEMALELKVTWDEQCAWKLTRPYTKHFRHAQTAGGTFSPHNFWASFEWLLAYDLRDFVLEERKHPPRGNTPVFQRPEWLTDEMDARFELEGGDRLKPWEE